MDRGRVEELVKRAIELYNAYRGAEARAFLEGVSDNIISVRFEGPFCYTCGVNEWVEDFKYILEDLGLKADLVEVVEPEDPRDPWRKGLFRVRC